MNSEETIPQNVQCATCLWRYFGSACYLDLFCPCHFAIGKYCIFKQKRIKLSYCFIKAFHQYVYNFNSLNAIRCAHHGLNESHVQSVCVKACWSPFLVLSSISIIWGWHEKWPQNVFNARTHQIINDQCEWRTKETQYRNAINIPIEMHFNEEFNWCQKFVHYSSWLWIFCEFWK